MLRVCKGIVTLFAKRWLAIKTVFKTRIGAGLTRRVVNFHELSHAKNRAKSTVPTVQHGQSQFVKIREMAETEVASGLMQSLVV